MRTTVQELALIEERLRGAAYDLRDCADGRHGRGARLRALERAGADAIAAECGRLRVLLLYLRCGWPLPEHALRGPPVAPVQPEPQGSERGS